METLLVLAGAVNRLVELVKRLIQERTNWDEERQRLAAFVAQILIGIAAAFVAQTQADILAGTPFARMGFLLGTLTAGLTLGLGAEAIHFVLDLTKSLTSTTTSATVTVSNPTAATSPQASASVSVGADTTIIAKG